MATHSGILAWEPGELQSMGSQRAGHGWAAKHTAICYKLYIKVVKRVNTRISQFSSIAQHTRLPCPSPTPEACSNPCPLSQWCHPTISSSVVPFSSCLQSFPALVFSNESAFPIRWPKYWSFSISPSNEYSGLISFRIDWFNLLVVQETLKSLLQHHSSKASILQHPKIYSKWIKYSN